MSKFNYDIAIIGTGRVGLPLGLMLAKVGFRCIGINKNLEIIEMTNNKKMPFKEFKFDDIIKEVDFFSTDDYNYIKKSKNIIITVGTPLMQHIETDVSQITAVLESMKDKIQPSHNIILRSTVAPKITNYVKNYLEKHTGFKVGKDIFLSFCPERLAEGKAYKELVDLPQIIGAEDDESFNKANEIFSKLAKKIFRTNFLSAELVKLFNNTSRYIDFAISNQFAIIAENYGQNIYDIIKMTNTDYPRGNIKAPGFTAGTCLRKDFGMLNENTPYSDILIGSWKINEYMPKFLVDNILKNSEIVDKNVAILGYTFKMDTDDTRDSLAPKLLRYIEKEVPNSIKIHEPFLKEIGNGYNNYSLLESIKDADIVYITINHSQFNQNKEEILKNAKNNCIFVDLWNVLGENKIFFKKFEGI